MNSVETNKEIARKFVDAWNARDLALLDELFHPDMTWHTAVTPPNVNEITLSAVSANGTDLRL